MPPKKKSVSLMCYALKAEEERLAAADEYREEEVRLDTIRSGAEVKERMAREDLADYMREKKTEVMHISVEGKVYRVEAEELVDNPATYSEIDVVT